MDKKFGINKEWEGVLQDYFETNKWRLLCSFVNKEYSLKTVFPIQENIFAAFNLTPFSQVRVVVLGQDPYHDVNQANGLCFSVNNNNILPPSLKNIFKEMENDLGCVKDFTDGNLEYLAKQGVFLLNTILTVIAHTPASHKNKGWEDFTDFVIKTISEKHEHVVFLLWGNYARSKKVLIDAQKHFILESSHPSPLSARHGFFGCKHFSLCNEYLQKHGKKTIVW